MTKGPQGLLQDDSEAGIEKKELGGGTSAFKFPSLVGPLPPCQVHIFLAYGRGVSFSFHVGACLGFINIL